MKIDRDIPTAILAAAASGMMAMSVTNNYSLFPGAEWVLIPMAIALVVLLWRGLKA